jgi:hypothetical protein
MDTAGFPIESTAQALGMLESAMGYLAAADHHQMPAETLADCLRTLERIDAVEAASRGWIIDAFQAQHGYTADAAQNSGTWMRYETKITKQEAAAHRAWARRAIEHPAIMKALAANVMSKSWAIRLVGWTNRIPEEFRGKAEEIIVAAAETGADLPDLIRIAAEILAATAPPDTDDQPFRDRSLRLEDTFEGAGVLAGELTPECTAMLRAVLDALSKPCGAEDDRSHQERYHDALEEAMRLLLGAGLMPEKGGHAVQAIVHIGLGDVLDLPDASVLLKQYAARYASRYAARWAGHRAATSEVTGDGGTWVSGRPAKALACDAAMFPIVTGDPDLDAMQPLVELCLQLHTLQQDAADGTGPIADRAAHADQVDTLIRQIIGQAAALLSGDGGLASFLRRNLLGHTGLGGPSLPLDVGDTDNIPWWLRRAVHTRDQHCQWPRGCDRPAARCQAHHIVHRADHGPTALVNLGDFCFFHHQVVIHGWGWKLKALGDGTYQATSPDGRTWKTGSRPPPPRPG